MPGPTSSNPEAGCADRERPFDDAWLSTVFLVPDPPRCWPGRFAIVTAHNPEGSPAGPKDNLAFESQLDDFLAAQGIASFEVTGASPDFRHEERGRGFVVRGIDEAAAIATRFLQKGFFWVEDGDVYVAVDGSGQRWPLARWSERLRIRP